MCPQRETGADTLLMMSSIEKSHPMFELLRRRRPQWAVIVQPEGVHVVDCGTGTWVPERWLPRRQWRAPCAGARWWDDAQVWTGLWEGLSVQWQTPHADVHVAVADRWLRQGRLELPADWPSEDVEAALQQAWAQEDYAQGRAWVLDHAPESSHSTSSGAMCTHRVDAIEQAMMEAMQAAWPRPGWRLCRVQPRSLALHRGCLLRWREDAPQCVVEIQGHAGVLSWLIDGVCWVKHTWPVGSDDEVSEAACLQRLQALVQTCSDRIFMQLNEVHTLRWTLVGDGLHERWGETLAAFWAQWPQLQAKRCVLDGSPQEWLALGAVGSLEVRHAVA